MRYLIQDDMPPEIQQWLAGQTVGNPDDGPKERLEVRLTPTELQNITIQAEAEGCTPQCWVVNCVRARLIHEPPFTMDMTEALWDSLSQLQAIGRNLNQIAKQLNEGRHAEVRAEQIEKLAIYIYRYTEEAAAVRDASLSRLGKKKDIEKYTK
ncbi:plasmid mobilization relaxosome protein MobC [Luteibacter sp. RCC_6_2]|uniref:plasmid mobilization protein n=1 Tax=Luteibacter sp. RCC_6_2 TaxID=3239223 RepID=UPI00352428E8